MRPPRVIFGKGWQFLEVSTSQAARPNVEAHSYVASHAGVFRGRDEKRAPLKTPALEANSYLDCVKQPQPPPPPLRGEGAAVRRLQLPRHGPTRDQQFLFIYLMVLTVCNNDNI